MSSEKLQDAIDLSHHISRLSKARATSPLKGLQKYVQPGLISLAGGLPNPAYFPFASVSGEALVPDSFPLKPEEGPSAFSWLWKLFGSDNKERTTTVTVNKYPATPGGLSLATALQYGTATGLPDLQKIQYEITEKIFQPHYKNFTTLVHAGNTDGWGKTAMTICNPGEGVLVTDWTYPSALAGIIPQHITPIPIAMDGQGMRADALRTALSEWDEAARGIPRPHVLYDVPIGQNPTGATMYGQRKKEIYDIAVEFDIIIVEDDPYYFLQQGPYVPKEQRSSDILDDEHFLASLAPSYLKFDYQGRVIRLDTFSKTIAPGCRLGWFTCNPVFAERLERQGEVSTQNPCGFGQAFVTSLLLQWHYAGFVRWVNALHVQYAGRRNYFIDTLAETFHLELEPATGGFRAGCDVYRASFKSKRITGGFSEKQNPVVFSFVPPTAGMFVWLKLHFETHPSYSTVGYKVLEQKLWVQLAEAGVMFGPGFIFSATPVTDETEGDGHFRISFSNSEFPELKKAIGIFAKVLGKFMVTAL